MQICYIFGAIFGTRTSLACWLFKCKISTADLRNLIFKTWHIYDLESEHAASESCALLSSVFKLIATQLPSDALPFGVESHSCVSLMKISLNMVPVVHQANVLSRPQNWPSLLAAVQSGIRWSSGIF
jgi:hypothetical protein